MDRFTTQDLSCNNKEYLFPPHQFFPFAAPFNPFYQSAIQKVYDACLSRGYFVSQGQSGEWVLEKVIIRDKDDVVIPNPSREQRWAGLFHEVFRIGSSSSGEWGHLRNLYAWRSHELDLVEGHRKPDIILVPKQKQHHRKVDFSSILTYCEVKESLKNPNPFDATLQLQQIAGYVAACQINRSFFIGSFLCGSCLFLALYARGNTFFSAPIDVNQDPLLFIKTILSMSFGFSCHLGFDIEFEIANGMYKISMNGFRGDDDETPVYLLNILPQTYCRSVCWRGRGTKVPLCKVGSTFYAIKDTWLLHPGPNDVDNHHLYITRAPRSLTPDEKALFGPADILDAFRGNKATLGTRKWDDRTYLRGIPVLVAANRVLISYDGSTPQDDTTLAILQRFSDWKKMKTYELRVHYRTLSETCGVSLPWFSCRREFLNGMMCAVVAHFNGLLKGLLHCDPSEANIWWSIDDPLDPKDVIPDWPSDHSKYPKRSAVLGDWGMAEDRQAVDKVWGGITGTYPFLSAELLSKKATLGQVRHEPWHDLEALFWVIWIVSVNSNGPYYTRREWLDYPEPPALPPCVDDTNASGAPSSNGPVHRITLPSVNTLRGCLRTPIDAVSEENKGVPVWATPGLHEFSSEDVFAFKRDIPQWEFLESMSPYWAGKGMAGDVFKEGMLELRNHFVWRSANAPPSEPITHQKFMSILGEMRNAIPAAEDTATAQDVDEARARYSRHIQTGGDLATALLDIPENPLLPRRQSGRKSTSRLANFPTVARLTSSKRKKAEGSQSRSESSSSKRQRIAEKNGGPASARRSPSPQRRGRYNTRSSTAVSTPTTSKAASTSARPRPQTRRTVSTPASASMSLLPNLTNPIVLTATLPDSGHPEK